MNKDDGVGANDVNLSVQGNKTSSSNLRQRTSSVDRTVFYQTPAFYEAWITPPTDPALAKSSSQLNGSSAGASSKGLLHATSTRYGIYASNMALGCALGCVLCGVGVLLWVMYDSDFYGLIPALIGLYSMYVSLSFNSMLWILCVDSFPCTSPFPVPSTRPICTFMSLCTFMLLTHTGLFSPFQSSFTQSTASLESVSISTR